jgi:hypothetical protein
VKRISAGLLSDRDGGEIEAIRTFSTFSEISRDRVNILVFSVDGAVGSVQTVENADCLCLKDNFVYKTGLLMFESDAEDVDAMWKVFFINRIKPAAQY